MNYLNPSSGGLNVILDQIKFLKEENFDVGILYYNFEEAANLINYIGDICPKFLIDDVNPNNDLVVVCEEFIWMALNYLKPRGIRYIIFNQGIFASLMSLKNFNEHLLAYEYAESVLTNSIHTKKGVEKIFQVPTNKIFMQRIGIDTSIYYPESKKNIACFLRYKNSGFSRFIEHFFKSMYPDWEIIPIENLPKSDTAAIFRKSKLFLSFGGPEGFGLPPLEAAFCGCRVIGFHGEAGREYFKYPTFISVNFMDHIDFIKKLKTLMLEFNNPHQQQYFEYVDYLKYFYSMKNSKLSTINFFRTMEKQLFNNI